jgi:hypothetical protein
MRRAIAAEDQGRPSARCGYDSGLRWAGKHFYRLIATLKSAHDPGPH